MKLLVIISSLLSYSFSVFAQPQFVKSKTCNTEIVLEHQVMDPITRSLGPVSVISDWYVDATGPRPTGFFKEEEKIKYDSFRAILNLGYKLTPSYEKNSSKVKTGDLALTITLICSRDGYSHFCSPVVYLNKNDRTPIGYMDWWQNITHGSLGTVINGTKITAVYKAIHASIILLPKCVVE